jgi:hypothetical protein
MQSVVMSAHVRELREGINVNIMMHNLPRRRVHDDFLTHLCNHFINNVHSSSYLAIQSISVTSSPSSIHHHYHYHYHCKGWNMIEDVTVQPLHLIIVSVTPSIIRSHRPVYCSSRVPMFHTVGDDTKISHTSHAKLTMGRRRRKTEERRRTTNQGMVS